MSEESERNNPLDNFTLKIPKIKAESETQTTSSLLNVSQGNPNIEEMETNQNINLRKRRNLSKNRALAMRQREKTPEPGRTLSPHEDTTTSDDEDVKPRTSSREKEADNTYEEMRRLVQEKAGTKDPVYDMDTEEVLEARAIAANDRRRRSVSPFALPDKEEMCRLERKGSFIDPSNKLLSTSYILSPKDEDLGRRNSLTIDTFTERRHSLTPPVSSSPRDKSDFLYPIPTTPKKLQEMVYPDEIADNNDKSKSKPTTPQKQDTLFTFEEKPRQTTPKPPENVPAPGEIVTKVIQVERTPSKKLTQENRPVVEIRQRVVRTPSRKSMSEIKPIVSRQINKPEEHGTPLPPVKPARSRSTSRFRGKTSESEMSEDQANKLNSNEIAPPKRKVVPTPRRFLKKGPHESRSRSVNRIEDLHVIDKTGTELTQTSKDIIELMSQARARSLSVPKDDPKLPTEYRKYTKSLMTPKNIPSTPKRSSRGISCPKTIQIISNQEILGSLASKIPTKEKCSRQSSGYVDASQSEYTSSCYSTSPSDNDYKFDLSERTAELTHKLIILSQEVNQLKTNDSRFHSEHSDSHPEKRLRKRHTSGKHKAEPTITTAQDEITTKKETLNKVPKVSRFKLIANWRQFKIEHKKEYDTMKLQRNTCISDLLLLIIYCGLGAMMFKTLEGSFENAYKCSSRNVKRDFIESLWRGSHYLKEEDWKSMARKKLFEFEDQLHNAHEAGVTSFSGQRSWNFMNSFVYCLTLITTIGYGHIAPKTTYGRTATIVYAIIGIPLFLIVLADFGKLFTRVIKFFWSFIRRFYYTRSCKKVRRTAPVQEVMKGLNIVYDVVRRPSQMLNEEDMKASVENVKSSQNQDDNGPPPLPPKPGTVVDYPDNLEPATPAPSVFEIDDEFNLPISLAIIILVVYMVIGAVGYTFWEPWTYFESFYFVFISMSTIGLGDLLPTHPMFMMCSILYLVFGLALTSMCINVVQVKLSDTFKKASAKIGATIGLKVAEEDGSLVPIGPPPTEIAPVHKPNKTEEAVPSKPNATHAKES